MSPNRNRGGPGDASPTRTACSIQPLSTRNLLGRSTATPEEIDLFPHDSSPSPISNLALSANCVGCDIVQADHAPEAGVAQGIFHGILVRHQGRIQEEEEEGLEEEVERRVEENTQEQVRMPMTMDGNEDTQTRLEPHVTMYA